MKIRHVLVGLVAVGALSVVGVVPALAGGPKVPTGCSFNQGVLTCVSSTSTQNTIGPLSTKQVPMSTTFDGFTGVQICDTAFGAAPYDFIAMLNVSLVEAVMTTTTTEAHGLHGSVFDTSTSTSTSLVSVSAIYPDRLICGILS